MKVYILIRELLQKLEVSQAVAFSLLFQGWSVLIGPVTIIVIAHWLSAEEQGFYYTFNSVLSLQVLAELGLATVIVQVASHEYAFLQSKTYNNKSQESRALSRLSSLMHFSLKWYFSCGLVIIAGLSMVGFFFFKSKPQPGIDWQPAWFVLCFIAGLNTMISPVLSIIEGCNKVSSIYSFRFIQGLLSSLSIIICMFLNFGLYSLPVCASVRLLSAILFIKLKHYNLIYKLLTLKITYRINWLEEVWPFQWRIGISWLSGFFIFSFITPIIFFFHGPIIAGQMGMTWMIASMVDSVSYAWINTRMPRFGIMVAKREFFELDRLFYRLFRITVVLAILCSSIIWLLIYIVHATKLTLGYRILPMLPVTLLLLYRIFNVMVSAMSFYLRAHKQEPMMIPSLISGLLVGITTWLLGANFGPDGAAAGVLLIVLFWSLPSCYVVFKKCQRKWHSDSYKNEYFNLKYSIIP